MVQNRVNSNTFWHNSVRNISFVLIRPLIITVKEFLLKLIFISLFYRSEKIFKNLQDEAGGPLNDLYILGGGKMQVDFEKKKINLFDQSEVFIALWNSIRRDHCDVFISDIWSCWSSKIKNGLTREISGFYHCTWTSRFECEELICSTKKS